MKSTTERRKINNIEQNINETKILLDLKDRKLQSRQQQILSINQNNPSNELRKGKHFSRQSISSHENSYSLSCHGKVNVNGYNDW